MSIDVTPRANPMIWTDEEAPSGVFIGAADDPVLIGLPTGLARKERMHLRPDATPSATLQQLLRDMLGHLQRGEMAAIPVLHLSGDDRALLADVMGDGEVTIVAGRNPAWQASEAVLAGVWAVRATGPDGAIVEDLVEIADAPRLVREAARLYAGPMPQAGTSLPPGVMNAPAVLAEIRERAEAWRPGEPNHVINFTLLPMTDEDIAWLTTVLGQAPLSIYSGGYGMARVHHTMVAHVWAVQYLNAMGTVILDTIEIGDVPACVVAAQADFEDSAGRLGEIIEAYLT